MDLDALDRATVAKLAREREIQCAGQLGAALIGGALAVIVALALPDTLAASSARGMVWALPAAFLLLACAQAVARRGWRRVRERVQGTVDGRALDRLVARTSLATIVLFLLGLVVLLPTAPTAAAVAVGDGAWWRIVLVVVTLLLALFCLAGARWLVVDLRRVRQGPPAPG